MSGSGRPLRAPRRARLGCAALALALVSPPYAALAQDQGSPKREDALDRLERALAREPGLAPETKDALRDVVEALRAERARAERPPQPSKGEIASVVDEYLSARPPVREKAAWETVMERLSLYGDFRLRHESSFDLDGQPDRHRERVRVRLGANYQVTDEILFGARINAGNPATPTAPHVTLGNVFHNFPISIDRAFLTYRPEWLEGFRLTGGKFNHPFYQDPVYGELAWGADVQPEGAVAEYALSNLGALERLAVVAGGYTVLEQAATEDTFLGAFQIAGRLRLADQLKVSPAVGYYLYSNVTPAGSKTILNDNAGNATVDTNGDGKPDEFRSRFGVLNPIVGLTYDGWKLPLTLAGEYILNTRARGGRDQGWAVGAALGKAEKQGDWRLYYHWQVVEQDAVFSPFVQSDFLLQTNHRSHLFGVNHQLTDKIGLQAWGLVSARDETSPGATTDSDLDQWRARLDLNIKF